MTKDWEILEGSYNLIKKNLKIRFPKHLSIIQYGKFYQVYDDDAIFFKNYFSLNSFVSNGKLTCGFPIFASNYFDDLRNMKKSFVRVDQLSEKKYGNIQRALSEIYTGKESDNSGGKQPPPSSNIIIKSQKIKQNKPNVLSTKNLPKTRPEQATGSSRSAPGKPKRTHAPAETNDYDKQYIDEPTGSREDFKKMRGRQHFGNKTGKH